jgi:hypothetical protein
VDNLGWRLHVCIVCPMSVVMSTLADQPFRQD